jgi:hypothetical protein
MPKMQNNFDEFWHTHRQTGDEYRLLYVVKTKLLIKFNCMLIHRDVTAINIMSRET